MRFAEGCVQQGEAGHDEVPEAFRLECRRCKLGRKTQNSLAALGEITGAATKASGAADLGNDCV